MARIERRELADGTLRYKVIVRRKGAPLKARTFRTQAAAAKWATKIEAAILDGRQLPSRDAERRTVADLVLAYTNREPIGETGLLGGNAAFLDLSPREQAQRIRQLDWWAERIGDTKLAAVTPGTVRTHLEGLTTAAATRNRYLAALRAAFSYAEGREWATTNPCRKRAGADRLARREPPGRVRFLSNAAFDPDAQQPDERTRLLDACKADPEPRLYPLVLLALSTGARQGELLRLRWCDVNVTEGTATLEHTKNRERRSLPLAGAALAVMRELSKVRRIDTDLIFADRRGAATFPKGAWSRALVAAKIKGYVFHDNRHSFASYMAMSGASLAELAELLGHKTLAMVKRYAHLSRGHKHALVAKMNERALGS